MTTKIKFAELPLNMPSAIDCAQGILDAVRDGAKLEQVLLETISKARSALRSSVGGGA